MSAVTLVDILTPLTHVDYLEADIQQSEILVFPPSMDLLKRKVRRIHIGTHGKDVHDALCGMFRRDGWHIVFHFEPNSSHTHPLGRLSERWRANRAEPGFPMRKPRHRRSRPGSEKSWMAGLRWP